MESNNETQAATGFPFWHKFLTCILLKQTHQYNTHWKARMQAVNTVLSCFHKVMQAECHQTLNQ